MTRCELCGPGSSGIPHGYCHYLGLLLVSSSAEQLKSPLQWMHEELLSDTCCRRVLPRLPCMRTWRSNFLSCGALATWMRWAARALALTDRCVDLGGCWAAPSRRIRAHLFWLECVKFIFDVSSSQRCRRDASSDSMRWSAMSGSPDSLYCFSKSWHSSSKHEVYIGRKPRGMEWRAAFWILGRIDTRGQTRDFCVVTL